MKKKKAPKPPSFLDKHPEAKGLFMVGVSLLVFLSLMSFSPASKGDNWLGLIGYSIGYSLTYLFGAASFFVGAYAMHLGILMISRGNLPHMKARHFHFALFLLSSCLLLNLMAELHAPFPSFLANKVPIETLVLDLPYPHMVMRHNLGGVPLYFIYKDLPGLNLCHLLSNFGIGITFSITAAVSLLLLTEVRFRTVWQVIVQLAQMIWNKWKHREKKPKESKAKLEHIALPDTAAPEPIFPQQPALALPKRKTKTSLKTKRELAIEAQEVYNGNFKKFKMPPPNLLHQPKKIDPNVLKKDLRRQAELLEETLMSFGIEAKVGEIHCGPTITSFEVHPSVGVKVQKIKTLANDIALNLEAKSIRIIAPIPGKAAVGVEVPSLYPQEVAFRELLEAYQRRTKKMQIPILLGKTVSGEMVFSDLAKMPHCIIAGATGSGKSVCINTIVMSIVMNARPDEVKLLMVDPKKVELTGYTNLPHMIAPVITEAHGAYAALSWLVKEMQNRYEVLKQMGLRNISAFNSRKVDKTFEEALDVEIPEKMPMLVAIIDEFADLMMASSSDLETPIARIAQMARAVGIHMILATQRPSREVITGLIKANFPTRISFKVASRINSQIILDETGAENLLGNGDMLFLPPGTSHLVRAQGSYINDEEINSIISHVCMQAPTNYLIPSFDSMPQEDLHILAGGGPDSEKDSLYNDALSIVVETGSASTTFLQRKLKIGYARAASLMDELESNGVIGPQEGARPRRVLVSSPGKSEEDSLPLD